MGFKNINNPCDLIVYRNGTLNLIECKAIHGNTLNFKSHIRDNQWQKLLDYSEISGINAGIICWFIDRDVTVFLNIQDINYMQKVENKKSFNINNCNENDFIRIEGNKKKVFFDYDLDKFLKGVQ